MSKPVAPAAPYLALSFTEATCLADVLALARAAINKSAPPCVCGGSPDLTLITEGGDCVNVSAALMEAEMACRSGDFDRLGGDTTDSASEYLIDRATVRSFDVANLLRKRLARSKATKGVAVRPGVVVSDVGVVVSVVGIGHAGDETGDRITLVSSGELAEFLHHENPRGRGLALLDAIAVAVEAFNPIEVAYEEEVRFACEGDTVETIYCGWDGKEFYRNAVIADDVAGEAVYIQFGPRVVGEA